MLRDVMSAAKAANATKKSLCQAPLRQHQYPEAAYGMGSEDNSLCLGL